MVEAISSEPIESVVCGRFLFEAESYDLRVQRDLLYIDAPTWLTSIRQRHLDEAERAFQDGDDEFAAEMRSIACQIESLLRDRFAVQVNTLWPQIVNRCRLRSWAIESNNDARSFAREIADCSINSEADSKVDFVVDLRRGHPKLYVSHALRTVAKYAGAFEANVLDNDEMEALVARTNLGGGHG